MTVFLQDGPYETLRFFESKGNAYETAPQIERFAGLFSEG